MSKILKVEETQKVTYCVPLPIRDEQIKLATARVKGRIQPHEGIRSEPCAIVCYGPSLNDTWQEVKNFQYIFSCSGSHKFLIEHGIIPTWHVEVDPRPHKVTLLGKPHVEVEYLIASTCHPAVFEHLAGMNVRLWHVFDNTEDAIRLLPPNEWALTGGCGVGVRVMTIARFLGFTEQHIFGMDGNIRKEGMHAAAHPMQPKEHSVCEYDGLTYLTTPSLLEAAKSTFHELDQMSDIKWKFYGEGLVQAMSRKYVPKPAKQKAVIGVLKPKLISDELVRLNRELHRQQLDYGFYGGKHAATVIKLLESIKSRSVLDYGCGKGYLAKELPFPIWEYDPCIPGKQESPRPADLVVCTDVLEHVEPDKLSFVLDDLRRCTKSIGYFVLQTGAASKCYSDGRNTHLIQESEAWWREKLAEFFNIGTIIAKNIMIGPSRRPEKQLHIIVSPKPKASASIRRWHVLENWVKQRNWTRGAEIGVKEGRTFLHLLEDCPWLTLYGVDIFEPRPGLEQEGGESNVEANLPEHEIRIRKIVAERYPQRGILIKGLSVIAANQVKDGSLDFAFIDADHRESAVLADIEAWKPKVRQGGVLCGHDAQESHPGVLRAINNALPGWKKHPDSVWEYQL